MHLRYSLSAGRQRQAAAVDPLTQHRLWYVGTRVPPTAGHRSTLLLLVRQARCKQKRTPATSIALGAPAAFTYRGAPAVCPRSSTGVLAGPHHHQASPPRRSTATTPVHQPCHRSACHRLLPPSLIAASSIIPVSIAVGTAPDACTCGCFALSLSLAIVAVTVAVSQLIADVIIAFAVSCSYLRKRGMCAHRA